MTCFILVYIVIVSLLCYLYIKSKLTNEHLDKLASKIAGPVSYPFVRNGLLFIGGRDPNTVISDLVQQYGTVFRVWLGSHLYIVLTDPDDIEVILNSSKHLTKADSYVFIKSWLGNGLITADGNTWMSHRKLLTPTFHFKILEQSLKVIYNHSLCLVSQLQKELHGQEFDIQNYIEKCSIDLLCESAMGVSLNTQVSGNSTYMDACKTVTNITVRRVFEIFLQSEIIFRLSGLYNTFIKALDIMNNTSQKVINDRKQELFHENSGQELNNVKEKRKVMPFLDMLLLESNLSDNEIQDEVKSFMFAGHDTTTAALSFIIQLLALHQDVQDKVVEEVEDKLPAFETCPTIQDLNNLKYLDQVIKEGLRLYPPVPMIGRKLNEDVKLPSGYTLPCGAHVNIYIYSIHRNPKVYESPLEFKPERFASDNQNRSAFSHIPFSAGSRNCIGQKFALFEMKIVLSTMLRKYRIIPTDRTSSIQIATKLILRPLDGIPVRLAVRE